MIKYEDFKEIVEKKIDKDGNEICKYLTKENYINKFKELSYDQKVTVLLYSYDDEDGIDDICYTDKEFIEKFKSGYSPKEMYVKAVFRDDDLDEFMDIEQFIKTNNNNKSMIESIKAINFSNYYYSAIKNNIISKLFKNNKIVEILSKDKDEGIKIFEDYYNIEKLSDVVKSNSKLQELLKHSIVNNLKNNENDTYNKYYVASKMSDKFRDELLNSIKKEIKINEITAENLSKLLISVVELEENSNTYEREKSQERLKKIIDKDYSIFEGKSDKFLSNYLSYVDSPNIMSDLLNNSNIKTRIIENEKMANKLLRQNIGNGLKIEILNNIKYSLNLSDLDISIQNIVLDNYNEFKDRVKLLGTLDSEKKLEEEIIKKIVSDNEKLKYLQLNDLINLYKDNIFQDKQYIIDRIFNMSNSEDNIYNIKDFPETILNSLDKNQRKKIYDELSYSALENMSKYNNEPLFKAYVEYRIDEEIKKLEKYHIFFEKDCYNLANEIQKQKILEESSGKMLLEIYSRNKDKEILKRLFSNDELIESLDSYSVERLIEDITLEEFKEIKEKINKEQLFKMNFWSTENDEGKKIVEYIGNYKREIINQDKELFNEIKDYDLYNFIKEGLVSEDYVINNISIEKSISLFNCFNDESTIKLKIKDKILDNISLNEEKIKYSHALEKFIEKLPLNEFDLIVNNISINAKLELIQDRDFRQKEKYNVILNSIKNTETVEDISDYKYRFNLLLSKLDKSEKENLISSLKIEQLISVCDYSDNSKNTDYLKNIIIDRYKNEIESFSKIDEYDLQRFVDNISEKDRELIFNINKEYILNKTGLTHKELLCEILNESNSIQEQKNIFAILNENKYSGESKEKLDYILKKNKFAIKTLNKDILSQEFYSYSTDLLEKIVRYPEIQNKLVEQVNNNKLGKFNLMLQTIVEGNEIYKSLPIINKIYEETFENEENKEIIDSLDNILTISQAENLKEYMLRNKSVIYGNSTIDDMIIPDIKNKEDIYNFKENLYKKCDDIFYSSNKIEDKINAFTTKYLGVSYNEANNLYSAYADGINNWYGNKILEMSQTPAEVNILALYETISNLRNIENDTKEEIENKFNTLEFLYEEYGEFNTNLSRESVEIMESNFKRIIAKGISQKLYKANENDFSRLEEYEGKSIPILELNGKFKLLVNSTSAYSMMKHIDSNYVDSWNKSDRTSNHGICCSLISDEYLGTAPVKDVLLGFSDFNEGALQHAAPYDLYTDNDRFVTTSDRENKFLMPDDIINNTRHTHNEIDIERFELRDKSIIPLKDRNYNNIQPSYVIMFTDMEDVFKDNAKKCAADFNIPILEIDREKCAKKNSNEIDALIGEYNYTKDLNKIKDIILKHENNRSGLRIERNDLVEKYFDCNKVNEVINDAIDEIVKGKEDGNLSQKEFEYNLKTLGCFVAEEEKKFDVTNENVARVNTIDINTLKYKFDIEKNINYYNKDSRVKDIIEGNNKFNLDKESIKNINQVIYESNQLINDENITQDEKNSFERKVIFTQKLLNDSGLTEENKILALKAQKFEILSKDDKEKILNKLNINSMTRNERLLTSVLKIIDSSNDVEKEKIKLKFRISELEEESITKITQILSNSRMIEIGDIEKTNLSNYEKEEMREYSKLLEKEYEYLKRQDKSIINKESKYDIKRETSSTSTPSI